METARGRKTIDFTLRRARKQDGVELAVLMDMASQGLVSSVWRNLAPLGGSPAEVGRARLRENEGLSSHFSNWTVLEQSHEVCGAFAGHVVPDPYDPGDTSGLPPDYLPVMELEAMARGCWFLMAIAVYAEFRRRGFGAALLGEAEAEARRSAAQRVALTVSSANEAALRLYARAGFSAWARRRQVPGPPPSRRAEWILLAKDIGR